MTYFKSEFFNLISLINYLKFQNVSKIKLTKTFARAYPNHSFNAIDKGLLGVCDVNEALRI